MVVTTPGCWTTVVLHHKIGYRHLLQYVERSENQPISLWLFEYPFRWDGNSRPAHRPVVDAQRRGRSVIIYASPRAGYPHDLIPPTLPLLEEIHVRDQGAGISAMRVRPDYPKLRVLRARSVSLALDGTITTTTLEELEFTLGPVTSIDRVSNLLRLNAGLRRLQIKTSIQPGLGAALWMGVEEVVLPRLASISFVCQSLSPVEALVYVLHAPKVSSVTFNHYALESPVEDYFSILRFCIKHFPELARIAFNGLIPLEWMRSILDVLSRHLHEGRVITVTLKNMGEITVQGSSSEGEPSQMVEV
ncbi:hypothetical protein FRC04_011577 [Tulasnella sp. 424]|nr:hypothetical protein FRC04_011577 [Tulasnella sp. 424]